DYVGLGIGAVSTVTGRRWRNAPGLRRYVEALESGERPPREVELLDDDTRARERLMLGLRLDEPLALDEALEGALDRPAPDRLERDGFVRVEQAAGSRRELRLTERGRPLGGGVTAALLA